MVIDETKCIGCGKCLSFCPVQARGFGRSASGGRTFIVIDKDKCIECGVCERAGVCPVDAMHMEELPWPRTVRGILSNPLLEFKATGVPGRGTEEIKTNEITVVPQLLAGRDLEGVVVTTDALHTQRALAQQILDQGGDYLMIVKKNQHQLYDSIDLLFQSPPLCKGEEERLSYTTHHKAHGRRETRTLETSAQLNAYVDWPGSQQVLRRTYHAVDLKTGAVVDKVTYGITSLSRQRVLPRHIAALRRAHWTIENKDHYVRDETMAEDRCQLHTGNSAQALAALRNAVLNVLRYQGWSSIPAAIRHYGASLHKALTLLGVPAP